MRPRSNRKQQILEAFALMLETQPGSRITTAKLAEHVGVSEAALYRHFPSKAKMIEALIEFVEESLFTRINRIQKGEGAGAPMQQCRSILLLVLSFAEHNPGFARLFVGDALQGESEKLRARMRQVFDRLETHLRQSLRDHQAQRTEIPRVPAGPGANLLMAAVEGRINQFVRSEFKTPPTADWDTQWDVLARGLF